MREMYFWCTSGEDGTRILSLTRESLLKRLDDCVHEGIPVKFLDYVPADDKGCWIGEPENSVLIIRGTIEVPRPVTKVTKLTI